MQSLIKMDVDDADNGVSNAGKNESYFSEDFAEDFERFAILIFSNL